MSSYGDQTDSKFRFVLVASRRAEQLVRGARPRLDLPAQKLTRVAMEEVRHGLVDWSLGPAPREEAGSTADEGTEAATAANAV